MNNDKNNIVNANDDNSSLEKNLGITQEYTGNRNLWDSNKSKEEFKDKIFGDSKTIKDGNGDILHRSHKAAQRKYREGYAEHAAEVDHKISLEYLHQNAKNNPFLSDNDLKDIANSHENYQIISKSKNASKGADNSADLITHAKIHGKFAARTAKNINDEFLSGAIESLNESEISVLKKSAEKLLLDGESIDETLNDAVEKTFDIAVKGGTERIVDDLKNSSEKTKDYIKNKTGSWIKEEIGDNIAGRVLSRNSDMLCDTAYSIITESVEKLLMEGESLEDTLTNAGEKFAETAVNKGSEILFDELKKSALDFINNSDNPALNTNLINGIAPNREIVQLVSFIKSNGEAIVKFIDGEITGEQLAEEIISSGLITCVSLIISTAVPIPFVAPFITNLSAKFAEFILDTKAHLDDYLIKEQMIHKLSIEAQAEMERKRLEFHDIVQKDFDKWDSVTEEAFYQIISNSFDENFNLDEIINGLDKILSLCGEEAEFHSVDEWEEQLDIPLNLSF